MLGLAYPGLTGISNGTDLGNDASGHTDQYSPFFYTAISENVVSRPCESSTGPTVGSADVS